MTDTAPLSASVARAGVVVVTFNSRAMFARLQAALVRQSVPFKLIVADNSSAPDQRPTAADFPGAEILQFKSNLGFAAANNRAAEPIDAPFLVLLNPDAFPEPDWLARLIAAADAHPEAGAIGSLQLMTENDSRYDGVGDCLHACGASWRGGHGAQRQPMKPAYAFSACAAAALYRTACWRAAGGFDERFFCYNEDIDLGFRLRLAGWETLQAPDAVVRHIGGGGARATRAFVAYHTTRNAIWCFVKNMPGALFWACLPLHALWMLYVVLAAHARGIGEPARRGLIDACRGLAAIWRSRREVQAARTTSIADIVNALTWSPLSIARRAAKLRRC